MPARGKVYSHEANRRGELCSLARFLRGSLLYKSSCDACEGGRGDRRGRGEGGREVLGVGCGALRVFSALACSFL